MPTITHLDILPIATPAIADDLDSASETLVVRVTDENGVTGIGECDAAASVAESFLTMPGAHFWNQSPMEILQGRDPLELRANWEALYEGTIYSGRRGLGIHALSAIDIALHDLAARQIDQPVYKLIGGACRSMLRPYATIWPGMPHERSLTQMLDATFELFEKARELGFTAFKMEVLYFDLATDSQLVDAIRQGRKHLGDDATMMVDFGYRWNDWHAAKWVIDRIEDSNIYFAEAALSHDNLRGHARLSKQTGVRICGAEMAATRFEIREWIEVGKVAVVQPDINRCGGFTEIIRIAELAAMDGVQVIPHGWKTGITAACARHFQAACPNCEFIEFHAPELSTSLLRKHLVSPEPELRDGCMELPSGSGLGIDLNDDFVRQHTVRRCDG